MLFDNDTNEDLQQKTKRKSKQKVETSDESSDEFEDKCSCRRGCSTRTCSCFKDGGGCGPSCRCKGNCRNMFNHLDYFFGAGRNYSAHACFAQWLKKNVKNADALQMVDRSNLYRRITKCPK